MFDPLFRELKRNPRGSRFQKPNSRGFNNSKFNNWQIITSKFQNKANFFSEEQCTFSTLKILLKLFEKNQKQSAENNFSVQLNFIKFEEKDPGWIFKLAGKIPEIDCQDFFPQTIAFPCLFYHHHFLFQSPQMQVALDVLNWRPGIIFILSFYTLCLDLKLAESWPAGHRSNR